MGEVSAGITQGRTGRTARQAGNAGERPAPGRTLLLPSDTELQEASGWDGRKERRRGEETR